jgi:hypothetical protein
MKKRYYQNQYLYGKGVKEIIILPDMTLAQYNILINFFLNNRK